MKNLFRFIFISLLFYSLSSNLVSAQNPLHTQFYYNSFFNTPSLAGSQFSNVRIMLNQRNQWLKVPDLLSSSTASIDFPIISRSNLGFVIYDNYEGEHFVNQSGFKSFYSYSPNIFTNSPLTIRFGLGLIYDQRHIDWSRYRFFDQFDPIIGFIGASNIPNPNTEKINNLAASASISFFYLPKINSNRILSSVSLSMVNLPLISKQYFQIFDINNYQYPWVFFLSAISVIPKQWDQSTSFIPYFRYYFDYYNADTTTPFKDHSQFRNIDFGLNTVYNTLTLGVGSKLSSYKSQIRNINHLVFLIAYDLPNKNQKLSFSLDVPISQVSNQLFITSEFNYIILIPARLSASGRYPEQRGGSKKCMDFVKKKTINSW